MPAVLACREKAQLQLLMRTVKLSIEHPFQRLAALTALFLAEAACALADPAAAMYPAVNRHLLRRASLDVQVDHHLRSSRLALLLWTGSNSVMYPGHYKE